MPTDVLFWIISLLIGILTDVISALLIRGLDLLKTASKAELEKNRRGKGWGPYLFALDMPSAHSI